MRVAYLTEWSPYGETGVLRKMVGQVQTWRDLGAAAELFALAPTREEEPACDFANYGQVVGALPQRSLDAWRFARLGYFNKIASVPKMGAALRRFSPDVIYYRQNGPWYPGIGALLRVAPSVMEINTDEAGENRMWGAGFDRLYRLTQDRVVRAVSGFVAVTGEIAERRSDLHKPVAVIGNSFWGEPLANAAPTGNDHPAFVFVGSPGMSWHGIDKVFALAAHMPESTIHVAGFTREDFPGAEALPNVIMHGVLSATELAALYRISDVGIGTLALHRKGMEEACPLKTREYLMNRLPVVIGYREVEPALNDAAFILQIGNTEDNVLRSLDAIADFARNWTNRRVDSDLTFLTRREKERERLRFLGGLSS